MNNTNNEKTLIDVENSSVVSTSSEIEYSDKHYLKLILIYFRTMYFGSSIVQMAIVWYVTMQTSSGIWLTILTLSSFLPQMIISPFAGVWADRYNKKKIIILADVLIAISTLILAIFLQLNNLVDTSLIAIVIVSIIRSIGTGIQTPTVNSMIPLLVPEDKLMKFNGINSIFFNK